MDSEQAVWTIHQLRTRVTVIRGYAQLLQHVTLPFVDQEPRIPQRTDALLSQIDRLTEAIGQLEQDLTAADRENDDDARAR